MATGLVETVADNAPDVLRTLPGADLPWLDAARRAQLDAFVRDGLPGNRNEAWKYTGLRALARQEFAHGDADAQDRSVSADTVALPGLDGPQLVFVNGVFRADLSNLDALPQGLDIQPLSRALADDPEPLRFFLTRDWDDQADAFARLNAAMAGDGMVLRVAAGTHLETPVHVVHVGAPAETQLAWHARNVVEVGEDAALTLVEHHAASDANSHLGTLVSDVDVRRAARLDWIMVQNTAPKATLMRRHTLRQDADSQVKLYTLELGGKLVRNDVDCRLRGEGAHLDTQGVFVPHARQHLDNYLDIRHEAGNTRSNALWRGVADQGGHGVFRGRIFVEPGADGTDAHLNNKNLLLSRKAVIDTQPVLEIWAEEVEATHGATVGQLDEPALFYLRSRGIDHATARNMLTAAFCREALQGLPIPDLQEHLDTALVDVLPLTEASA